VVSETGEVLSTRAEDLLTDYWVIHTYYGLQQFVEDLMTNFIQKNLLVEVEGNISISEFADSLRKNLNLSDTVNIVLATVPGGTKYQLTCDMYHGAGLFKKL